MLCDSFQKNMLFAISPSVNETARHLPTVIVLMLSDGFLFDTGSMFEYRKNPVFTDIRPRNHLTVWVCRL